MSINTSSYLSQNSFASTAPQGNYPFEETLENLIPSGTTTRSILSPRSSLHSFTYLPTSESFDSSIPPTIHETAKPILFPHHSASSSLPVLSTSISCSSQTPIPYSKDPLPERSLKTGDTPRSLTPALADQSSDQVSKAPTKKRKKKARDETSRKKHKESETLRRRRNKVQKLQLIEDQKKLITMVKDFDDKVKAMFSLDNSSERNISGIDVGPLDKIFGKYVNRIPRLFNILITQVQQNQNVKDHTYTPTQVKGLPDLLEMAKTVATCVNIFNKRIGEPVLLPDAPPDLDAATRYYATCIPSAIIQMVQSHSNNLDMLQFEILTTRARENELRKENQRLIVENLRLQLGMSQFASHILKRDDSSLFI